MARQPRRAGARPEKTSAEKTCAVCGRRIDWRAKWARDWEHVRYCSDTYRARGVRTVDRELERAIVALLDRRAAGATICPSEAARAVAGRDGDGDGDDGGAAWRALMEPARAAARRLVAAGVVDIVQDGAVVDPSTARGPIRIRARRR